MNAQRSTARRIVRVEAGGALRLARLGGEMRVLEGRAWLTHRGAAGDRLVEAGERLLIAVDDDAVIEPYDAGTVLALHFAPRRQGLFGAVLELPLRVMASGAALAATACVALARIVDAAARRAQGRVA